MSARILLPVWPHVKKYLQIQYGQEMALSDIGIVSFLFLNMLEKHKKGDPATIRPNQKLIDNIKFVPYPVFIGDKYESSRGLYISNDKIKRFNESVDNALREEMYRWCQHPGSVDHKVDFDIVRFRNLYDITEEELPFENLKRWYYRERIRLDQRGRQEVRYEPQFVLTY